MITYWKKVDEDGVVELHIQKEFEWGNDLTCVEDGEIGTYIPLSLQEHFERGYMQITFEEAQELIEMAGYELTKES